MIPITVQYTIPCRSLSFPIQHGWSCPSHPLCSLSVTTCSPYRSRQSNNMVDPAHPPSLLAVRYGLTFLLKTGASQLFRPSHPSSWHPSPCSIPITLLTSLPVLPPLLPNLDNVMRDRKEFPITCHHTFVLTWFFFTAAIFFTHDINMHATEDNVELALLPGLENDSGAHFRQLSPPIILVMLI